MFYLLIFGLTACINPAYVGAGESEIIYDIQEAKNGSTIIKDQIMSNEENDVYCNAPNLQRTDEEKQTTIQAGVTFVKKLAKDVFGAAATIGTHIGHRIQSVAHWSKNKLEKYWKNDKIEQKEDSENLEDNQNTDDKNVQNAHLDHVTHNQGGMINNATEGMKQSDHTRVQEA